MLHKSVKKGYRDGLNVSAQIADRNISSTVSTYPSGPQTRTNPLLLGEGMVFAITS
jgi:hypothetical protein